ncbi:MAG: tRNA guanosine(34) transglycosylase Tgt [Alphaproteobacteria bacterium]|nr:tRNA guanosine(34) transglycosylase Tgt [Alphaproteobacteria bacterium]
MRVTVFKFDYTEHSPGRARLGRITTPHGVIETPAFIFCATKAAMKGLSAEDMRNAGTQIILSNTYHLLLQPGPEVVKKMGGLQKFTGWKGPMLTDSGGFQIFSLGHGSVASEIKGKRMTGRQKTLLKITEEGACFKSYVDGRSYLLTPEASVRIQRDLGADLIVVLDECTPYHVDKHYTAESMQMSHRWALRSLAEFRRGDDGTQSLYGIIQGGVYPDLRKEGCEFVNSHPFFGHAVGGSLGASKDQMHEVVGITTEHLSRERPIHLLGIGGVSDIFSGVEQGIDTFDCVHPTRLARHGGALVKPNTEEASEKEHINLRNSQFRFDSAPIEQGCPCQTCTSYSRAYIHHLLKAQELLAYTLISIHNVSFMNRLMAAVRKALLENTWVQTKKEWCRLK